MLGHVSQRIAMGPEQGHYDCDRQDGSWSICLTNIHRHSGSTAANIRLPSDAESVSLEVTDYGRGIPPEQLRRCNGNRAALGVGIAGMRERVRQLGGQLQVSSSEQGTTVKAILAVGGEA
jgi:two-component system NarL family sensor kinase